MKFNIGDTVRCVDALGSSTVKKNELYVVSSYFGNKIILAGYPDCCFHVWRFELCIGNDYNRQFVIKE